MSIPIKLVLVVQEPIKIHLEKGQAPFDEHDRKHSVTSAEDHLFPEGDHSDEYLRKDGTWATPPGGSGTDHNRQHDVTSSDDHQMNTGVILGRTSENRGAPEELTAGTTRNLLNIEDGATAAGAVGDAHASTTHAPANAQKNVQSDWNQDDSQLDDHIKNKPVTMPPSAHQHDAGDIPGLGDAAGKNVGTGATDVAAGDHGHTQLHDRKHSVTSAEDHLFPEGDHGDEYLRKDGSWATPPDTGAGSDMTNHLISGGIVTWTGSGYTYNVTAAEAYILGEIVEAASKILALSTPDPTHNRIDVVALGADEGIFVIEGTPAASPIKPQIEPATQVELTSILVEAGSTQPSYMTGDTLYDENEVTEWVPSSILTGLASVVFNDTSSPYRGTKAINVSNIEHGNRLVFTKPEGLINISQYKTLSLWVKFKAPLVRQFTFYLHFRNGQTPVGMAYITVDRDSTDYQQIAIPIETINLTGEADNFTIHWYKTGQKIPFIGLFIDSIILQKGLEPPPDNQVDCDPLQITNVVLYAANWTTGATFKEYQLLNTNIQANTSVEVIPNNEHSNIVKEAEILPSTTSEPGAVTIFSTKIPTANITVTLKLERVKLWQ